MSGGTWPAAFRDVCLDLFWKLLERRRGHRGRLRDRWAVPSGTRLLLGAFCQFWIDFQSIKVDKYLFVCQNRSFMVKKVRVRNLPKPIPPFSELLRNRRNAAGLTLSELGEACSVDPADISRWEANKRKPPERPVVVRICRALGLELDEDEAVLLLAAAERDRYENDKDADLLDVAQYRRGVRAIPIHNNPVLTAKDELELIEQLVKVVREAGWQKVTVRLPGKVVQEIVREDLVGNERPIVTRRRRRR